MNRSALSLALVAVLAPVPALACGPSGGEALLIGGLLGALLMTATFGQWASVRLLSYGAASSWHLGYKILAALPAAVVVGAGLAVGFTALAKGATGFGIVLVCIELLVLLSALRVAFWNHRLGRAPVDI